MDGKIKIFGVLGPIGESHQPGITKTFVKSYGNFKICCQKFSQLAEIFSEVLTFSCPHWTTDSRNLVKTQVFRDKYVTPLFFTTIWLVSLGRQNCVEAYSKLAEALHEGGIDGFLLETMNYWDEALIALEGLELFLRKVMVEICK